MPAFGIERLGALLHVAIEVHFFGRKRERAPGQPRGGTQPAQGLPAHAHQVPKHRPDRTPRDTVVVRHGVAIEHQVGEQRTDKARHGAKRGRDRHVFVHRLLFERLHDDRTPAGGGRARYREQEMFLPCELDHVSDGARPVRVQRCRRAVAVDQWAERHRAGIQHGLPLTGVQGVGHGNRQATPTEAQRAHTLDLWRAVTADPLGHRQQVRRLQLAEPGRYVWGRAKRVPMIAHV